MPSQPIAVEATGRPCAKAVRILTRIPLLARSGTTTAGARRSGAGAATYPVTYTAEAFATTTVRLLSDRRLAHELARNGRRLVETAYDYRSVCQDIERVYESVRAARSGRG